MTPATSVSLGKCPKCSQGLSRVNVEPMQFYAHTAHIGAGYSYVCPHCQTVLGVSAALPAIFAASPTLE